MSWSLSAAGHTPDEDAERKLHAELAEVLAKPEYGCTTSDFIGNHVQGTVHLHASADTEHVHETDGG